MDVLQQQVKQLLQFKLYDSAELLGYFLLSTGSFPMQSVSPETRIENLVLFADALAGKREFRRSVQYYRQVVQTLCLLDSTDPQSREARAVFETNVHVKIAACLMELNEPKEAIAELETISHRHRDVTVLGWLARLYRAAGYKRAAVATYKECVRQCPFAVEALVALAELGVKYVELLELIPQGANKPANTASTTGTPTAMPQQTHSNAQTNRLAPSSPFGHHSTPGKLRRQYSSATSPPAKVPCTQAMEFAIAEEDTLAWKTGGHGSTPPGIGGGISGGTTDSAWQGGAWDCSHNFGQLQQNKGVPSESDDCRSFGESKKSVAAPSGGSRGACSEHQGMATPADLCAGDRVGIRAESPLVVQATAGCLERGCTAASCKVQGRPKDTSQEAMECLGPASSASLLPETRVWLHPYVQGVAELTAQNLGAAAHHFQRLCQLYPDVLPLYWLAGRAAFEQGDLSSAAGLFSQSRLLDKRNVRGMDSYALLLQGRDQQQELAKLVGELMATDPGRSEAWVAAAALSEMSQQVERALDYVEQGLKLDPRNNLLFIMKGHLLLPTQPEAALSCFRTAQELEPSLRAFRGVVNAALRVGNVEEALAAARLAVQQVPYGGGALALLGHVYMEMQQLNKALQLYEEAIQCEPRCLEAVLALSGVLLQVKQGGQALNTLRALLAVKPSEMLHAKLGCVLASFNQPEEALHHFQAALSLNPHCRDALEGMAGLEQQLRSAAGCSEAQVGAAGEELMTEGGASVAQDAGWDFDGDEDLEVDF